MRYYAMGIKYDTDGLEIAGLPTNMMVDTDDIDKVRLEISTDLGFTADFLRELANAIEEGDEFRDFETFRGVARISWPAGE